MMKAQQQKIVMLYVFFFRVFIASIISIITVLYFKLELEHRWLFRKNLRFPKNDNKNEKNEIYIINAITGDQDELAEGGNTENIYFKGERTMRHRSNTVRRRRGTRTEGLT